MTILVVATFKSNKTLAQVESWLQEVVPTLPQLSPKVTPIVAPSFPHLPLAISHWPLAISAQDVSPFPPGSYTGAVSAVQLKELGISYVIVGHSERRRYFHETASDVASKVRELVASDIIPIVCMEEGDIVPQFAALEPEYLLKCIYCFEPSGDIGGTVAAPLDEISTVKDRVMQFTGGAKFMYGGSVNADNVTTLLTLKLDGFLVATACLEPSSFISVLEKVGHGA